MITNEVSVTILHAYFSLPRHILEGRWIITSDLCTAVGCQQFCNESRKLQRRIMFERNQARSHDLEKGGLFWKSKKCANDLDSNFHWSWISFRRFVQNLRRNVSQSSEIQSFFPPKVGWSPKKKKRSSPKFRVIFRPKSEFQRFFPPKIRWSPKKKQRSSPKFRVIFRPKSEIQRFFPPKIRWSPKKKGLCQNWDWYFVQFRKFRRLRGGCFRMGGLFSIFHIKSASKAQKTCDLAYFTSQWGGSSPPWLCYWT